MAQLTNITLLIFVVFTIFLVCLVQEYLSAASDDQADIHPAIKTIELVHKYPTQGQLPLDMKRGSYRLWKNDGPSNVCFKFETRFGINLKRVWLLSYPGSGNTWTRYLMEAATGVFTGSVYMDKKLYEKGFLGEFEAMTSGSTLTQKSHDGSLYDSHKELDNLFQHNRESFDIPCVLIIRHPKRAITAYWNFLKHTGNDPHISKAPMSSFETNEFHDFVKIAVLQWERLIIERLLWTNEPVYIIYYENLIKNVTHELRDLLGFLG